MIQCCLILVASSFAGTSLALECSSPTLKGASGVIGNKHRYKTTGSCTHSWEKKETSAGSSTTAAYAITFAYVGSASWDRLTGEAVEKLKFTGDATGERYASANCMQDPFLKDPPGGAASCGSVKVQAKIAEHAAGALAAATGLVMAGSARNAFCAVRPPGHHAERDAAMGFCFFNNVAVGAAHALATGAERVAILDFDVHHGNGTEDIFADEPRVLFCSSFQHPYYPGVWRKSVPGRRVNTPLAAGAGSAEFRAAVTERWLPEIERFDPAMIFVSAGFDAHRDDPLAGLRLDDEDYAWVTRQITDLAARHCDGRVVSTLEGGYDLGAVGRCAALHVKGLMGAAG
jgi:hypothetical protein